LDGLENLFKTIYLKEYVKRKILGKSFTARRTLMLVFFDIHLTCYFNLFDYFKFRNPLTIGLFDQSNKSISDEIVKENRLLVIDKIETVSKFFFLIIQTDQKLKLFVVFFKNMIFNGFITYIDEESVLTYVQMKKNFEFEKMMQELNDFYMKSKLDSIKALKFETTTKIQSESYRNQNFFCARYFLDNMWYRVKFVRSTGQNKIQVHFIDFGNKEIVSSDDILLIPEQFAVFANMPPQVNCSH
jgi:hypothetical protein